MDLRLAIFDLDGTLVDSRGVISWAMDEAFRSVGREPPGYERTRHIVGLSLDVACAELAGPETTEAELHRLVEAYKRAFLTNRAERRIAEPLYDGAEALLATLADGGWLLSIATGKARRGVDAFFEHHPQLKPMFLSTHCADDGPGKPHPAMLEAALTRTGVDRRRAVMIGDSVHDVHMARAARIHPVGVTWGFHERDELHRAEAAFIADCFGGLEGHLGEVFAMQAP